MYTTHYQQPGSMAMYGQQAQPPMYTQAQPYPQMMASMPLPPNPPEVTSYRAGIVGGFKVSGEEQVAVAKQYFREFLSSMHSGKVTDCIFAWMSDEIEWYSERLPLPLKAKGKIEACTLYNTVLEKVMGGPNATVTMHLDDARYLAQHDVVRIDFTTSVVRMGAVTSYVESKRFTLKFDDDMKIVRIVVSPQDTYSMSIGACPEACIAPVADRQYEKAAPKNFCPPREATKAPSDTASSTGCSSEELSSSSAGTTLQPPTTDRPCLHNNWDSVRVKRGYALLRCRTCSSQWKLPSTSVKRCSKYLNKTCTLGTLCTCLHVNSRKQTYEERTGMKLPESV
eukprot:TRINITY_DN1962_c1_g2_i1.p1 TRINITY_DN1962_c1_g2~~TRINITY_DN1962_c1_g2_i1.p1  ORF type:complete len:339 (+),score=71.20 TRINITY_DN1962_c1_g2_i1:1857-2873(+)